jgi:hypothetical protein
MAETRPPHLDHPIPIDLDKPRHLLFENLALLQAEAELCKFWGRPINLVRLLMEVESITLNDLAILVWQGCLWEDPSLTLTDVRKAMDPLKYGVLLTAVYAAWNAATAPAEPVPEGQDPGPFASVSPGSGTGALPASNSG